MGRKGITKDDVRAALNRLAEADSSATPTAIRRELGGTGSYSTIQKYVLEIGAETTAIPKLEAATPDIPEELAGLTSEIARKAWNFAHHAAQQEIEAVRQSSFQRLDEVQGQFDRAVEFIDTIEQERDALIDALNSAHKEIDDRMETIGALREEGAKLQTELHASEKLLAEFRRREEKYSLLLEKVETQLASKERSKARASTRRSKKGQETQEAQENQVGLPVD